MGVAKIFSFDCDDTHKSLFLSLSLFLPRQHATTPPPSLRSRCVASLDPQREHHPQARTPHRTPHWRKLPIVLQEHVHQIVHQPTHHIARAQQIQRFGRHARGARGGHAARIHPETLEGVGRRGVGALEAEEFLLVGGEEEGIVLEKR